MRKLAVVYISFNSKGNIKLICMLISLTAFSGLVPEMGIVLDILLAVIESFRLLSTTTFGIVIIFSPFCDSMFSRVRVASSLA